MVNNAILCLWMVDKCQTICYYKNNIPTKPLPQGMRNLVGLFLGAE